MFGEDDLLMISALQHLAFCERQCALIHIENQWVENRLTILGRILHEKTHSDRPESRGDVRIARGLRLVSYRLGLVGQADVVEFQRQKEGGEGGVCIAGLNGRWLPFPVEYKRGKPKIGDEDEVQLCAQALCLEEQLEISILKGALYYGQPRRRHPVEFDEMLRQRTVFMARRLHVLIESGKTPPAVYGPKCKSCSLYDICNPTWKKMAERERYEKMLFEEVK